MPPVYISSLSSSLFSLYHRIHAHGSPQLPYRNTLDIVANRQIRYMRCPFVRQNFMSHGSHISVNKYSRRQGYHIEMVLIRRRSCAYSCRLKIKGYLIAGVGICLSSRNPNHYTANAALCAHKYQTTLLFTKSCSIISSFPNSSRTFA